jgi:hypothetical protein
MGTIAQVEELQREIRRRLSDANVSVDPPENGSGSWWVDVERDGRTASLEWRPNTGFGVATPGGAYGEGPDYVVADPSAAAEHIAQILGRGIDRRRAEELEEQVESILRSMQAAKQHYEEVMRAIGAQMGIHLPPTLRSEMTSVADDVRRVELELLEMAESILRPRADTTRVADKAEN